MIRLHVATNPCIITRRTRPASKTSYPDTILIIAAAAENEATQNLACVIDINIYSNGKSMLIVIRVTGAVSLSARYKNRRVD